jgi:hypothetical protein
MTIRFHVWDQISHRNYILQEDLTVDPLSENSRPLDSSWIEQPTPGFLLDRTVDPWIPLGSNSRPLDSSRMEQWASRIKQSAPGFLFGADFSNYVLYKGLGIKFSSHKPTLQFNTPFYSILFWIHQVVKLISYLISQVATKVA